MVQVIFQTMVIPQLQSIDKVVDVPRFCGSCTFLGCKSHSCVMSG